MLRFLFENHHLYSADPDHRGRNLLHAAASSGDADTVRFAMDVLGFDPLSGDLQGITPLDLAQQARNQDAFTIWSILPLYSFPPCRFIIPGILCTGGKSAMPFMTWNRPGWPDFPADSDTGLRIFLFSRESTGSSPP